MTGATSRLGRALLPRLLRRWPEAQLSLLIRARGRDSARQRLEALLAPQGSRRVSLLEGKLEGERFGLDVATWSALGERVTHVLHLGGPTHLGTPARLATAALRTSAHSVLDLARRAQDAGRLQRLDVCSCTLVAGPGALGFDEDSPPALDGHLHDITRVRAEVEGLLRAEAGELPLSVHRLGLMAPAKSRLLRSVARMPRGLSTRRLDVAPTESVAEALTSILDAPGSVGLTTHLAAGRRHAIPAPSALLPALAAALTQCPPLRFSSFALLKHTSAGALYQDRDWAGWDDARPLLRLLAGPGAEVETRRTEALLRRLEVPRLAFL